MIWEHARELMGAGPAPVVCVLGPTSVANADGTRAALAGQQGDVLALLVAMHPSGVRTDVLYEVLWGERAPRTAATGLRVVVNRLRDRLAHAHSDAIVNEAGHYRLAIDADQIDMHRFTDLIAEARRLVDSGEVDLAIEAYEAALGLWHGESFQSTGDLGPLIGVQTRLDESKADAEERLVEALMLAGRNDDAVVTASSVMRDFELRERRWELLVLALYRAGRQAEALRAYRRGVRMLADEYGLQPGPQLAELEMRILEQDPSLLLARPEAATGGEVEGTLAVTSILAAIRRAPAVPAIASPLFGRDDDLQTVGELLARHRMLTIVGPAGVGKTRLATQLAQNGTNGRVIWLDLVVRDPSTIVDELASQLGVGGHGGRVIDAVLRALSTSPALLVFDNCEHVIDAIVPIAEAMVQHCPTLRVVSTSRVAFDSQSEVSVALAPLDRDAARHLVLDRLSGVDGRVAITDEELDALVEAVDRIPLALELVTSRLRSRPIASVLAELGESLDSLSGARRTDQRHVGLKEALDWSIDLLDDDALPIYEALGVMVGAFRPRHLATMLDLPVADVARQVEALSDLSLVSPVAIGDLPTFRALQTVGLHARSRLIEKGRLKELSARHARVFGEVIHTSARGLSGPDEEGAVATIRSSIGQIRGAFQWALQHDLELAQQIAVDSWEYSFLRLDFGLVPMALNAVTAMNEHDLEPSPDLMATASFASWALGLMDEGLELSHRAERAAVAAGQPVPVRAMQTRANIASLVGDEKTVEESLLTALEVTKEIGDTVREADVMVAVVLGLVKLGLSDAANTVAENCLRIAVDSQNASLIAWARYGLGVANSDLSPRLARREFVESIRVARTVDNRWVECMATAGLVRVHSALGEHHDAARMLGPLIEMWRGAGMSGMVVQSAKQAALILDAVDRPDAALAAVIALEELGSTPSLLEFDGAAYDELVERCGVADVAANAKQSAMPPPPTSLDSVAFEIRALLAQLLQPSGQ